MAKAMMEGIIPQVNAGYVNHRLEAGTTHEVPVPVPDGHTRVVWDFFTADMDIGFAATFYPAAGGEPTVVVEEARVDSHQLPQSGSYDATEAGTVMLSWFNTFSIFRAKNLTFTITTDTYIPLNEADEGLFAVRTLYGPGVVMEIRKDGTMVVELGFGTGYLQRSAITSSCVQQGKFAAKTRHQLARVDELWGLLSLRGLTAEEQAYCTEQCLLRYLRARDWDVSQAYKMVDASLRWRFEEVRPFELLGNNMELFLPYMKVYIAGYDKENRPVIVVRMGVPEEIATENKIQVTLFAIEKALQLLPAEQEQLTWVFDFKGFGRKHVDYRYGKLFPSIMQQHYPERLAQAIVLNAPGVFYAVWQFVKPLISKRTREKVVWIKSDEDESSLKTLSWLMDSKVVNSVLAEFPDFSLLTQTQTLPLPALSDTTPVATATAPAKRTLFVPSSTDLKVSGDKSFSAKPVKFAKASEIAAAAAASRGAGGAGVGAGAGTGFGDGDVETASAPPPTPVAPPQGPPQSPHSPAPLSARVHVHPHIAEP